MLSWAVPSLAIVAYLVLAAWGERLPRAGRLILWTLAWWLHGLALVESFAGSPAMFGFGPALSATAWLVLCVYAIESRALPALQSHRGTLVLAALALVVALVFPGRALPPTTSFWQPLHWVLGIASYGLLAAAVIHGVLMSAAERRMRLALDPRGGLPILTLERLTFHLVGMGFFVLSLTLLLATWKMGVLGGDAAGNPVHWRWDHKTVLSWLSWLVLAVLLTGRHLLGWRGPKAVRFLYLGAACLFLAYVGSHFVKEVLLGRTT